MEITVSALARGQVLQAQDLDDEDFTLVVDKANYYMFKVDDIEKSFAHHNWEDLAANRDAYRMKDQFDQEVLGYLAGYKQSGLNGNADTVNDQVNGVRAVSTAGTDELLSSMKLNKGDFGSITTTGADDHSIPIGPRMPGASSLPTTYVSPHQVITRMGRLLDQQFVDKDGRWLVMDPVMWEIMQDEDSRFGNADFGESGSLRNGLVLNRWNGFRVYVSNNLPVVGTGPGTTGTANQNANYGVIVAGHDSSVAAAERMNTTESYRDPDSFADIVRGMHLYGRKILRSEALVTAKYNLA